MLAVVCCAVSTVAAQTAEAPPPETQATTGEATTQPTKVPENKLATPYQAVQHFLGIVEDDEAGPERFGRATVCLDLSALDPEVRKAKGPELAGQLFEILVAMQAAGYFDSEDEEVLPDEPALESGKLQSFGRDPIVLVLERIPRVIRDEKGEVLATLQEWRFSTSTVARIPEWHSDLARLLERMGEAVKPSVPTPAAAGDVKEGALGSPFDTVTYFLDTARAAQEEGGELYRKAFACLDFSAVIAAAVRKESKLEDPAAVEMEVRRRGADFVQQYVTENGVQYVDALARILGALQDTGDLDLEKLPKSLPEEHKGYWALGRKPLELLLVRHADGRWRFSADTVRKALEMDESLKKPVEAGPAEVVPPPAAAVQEPAAKETPAPVVREPRPASRAPKQFRSPRATLGTFRKAMRMGDLTTAVDCLDLSQLTDTERELAHTLAGKLWLVMMRHEQVPLATVPDDPAGDAYELLSRPEGRIELDRVWNEARVEQWLFTSRTVRDIEKLYEAVESEPIHESWQDVQVRFVSLPALYVRELINAQIYDRTFKVTDPETGEVTRYTREGKWPKWLGAQVGTLRVWQWIGVLLVVLLGLLVLWVSQRILSSLVAGWMRSRATETMSRDIARRAVLPMSLLAMLAAWWGGLQMLDLGAPLMSWTWFVLKIVLAVTAVFTVYRLIDLIALYFRERAAKTRSRLDDVLVPLVQKTMKVVVVAVGCVAVATTVGFEVTPLLAGLGVGGLAFGLAAQDTLKNYFGSVNVVLDRPFQVGDWVKIGDSEGTVESVGLRSSRIRTFYNSQLTIPNSEIMNATVDNLGRRRYRRTFTTLSVTYSTTPEQLDAFCEGIREIIRQHPFTRKDYFHVYVSEFGDSYIGIMLYCFHECPDWATELRERHRLYLDIIRLAQRLEVEFAFPTQTIHLHQEETPAPATLVPRGSEAALKHGREVAGRIIEETLG